MAILLYSGCNGFGYIGLKLKLGRVFDVHEGLAGRCLVTDIHPLPGHHSIEGRKDFHIPHHRPGFGYGPFGNPVTGISDLKIGACHRVLVEQGGEAFRIPFGLLQSDLSLFQASFNFWRMESGKQFSSFYLLAQDYWHVGYAAGRLGLHGRAELGSHRADYLLDGNQRFGFDGLGADLNRRQLGFRGNVALVRLVATGKEHHPRWQSEQVRPQPTTSGCIPTLRN
jgi:hypothetical protein